MKEVKEKLQIPKNINNGRCLMDCLTKKIYFDMQHDFELFKIRDN